VGTTTSTPKPGFIVDRAASGPAVGQLTSFALGIGDVIGLLDRLAKPTAATIHLDGTRTVELTGPEHYVKELQRIVKRRGIEDARVTFVATIIPEKRNRHDPNAIGVLGDGQLIGYLSREDALLYRPHLDTLAASGLRIQTKGVIFAGHSGGTYWSVGVRMPRPAKMPSGPA
jgi:hypothetical protein